MKGSGSALEKMIQRLSRVLFYCGAVFLFLLMALITFEVIARRFLGQPTSWSFEVSTYLMAFIVFLPIAYVLQIRRHIAVSFLYDAVPRGTRVIMDLIAPILAFVWAACLAWQTGRQAYASLAHEWTSGTQLSVPVGYLQAFMFLGAFLLCLEFILLIISQVQIVLAGQIPEPKQKEASH
jgi:TRAP-type C4-dicarboxylate transport system permease small subunit